MSNNRTQQQTLESSPCNAEPFRKRIKIDDPLDVTSSNFNITTTASYQQTGPLSHAEPVGLSASIQWISAVEDALLVLKKRRLEEEQQPVYIPPMAKANLRARDDDLFPLMDKVEEFLASDRQVMLILGDSGSGKSTFNKHLERVLLQSYSRGGRIPLFINLPAIREPEEDMVVKQLQSHNFTEDQVQEMRQNRKFIVICDGYDESQLTTNLHASNFFNRPDQWDVKLIISCRSQYLGQDYRDRFVPRGVSHYNSPSLDLFQEAAIASFSKEQIKDYVEQYVPLEPRTWATQDYMDRLTTIPNLMDLVKNPFLLSLSLEALPNVTEGKLNLLTIKITRVQLYDIFVDHWLNANKRRLQRNVLSKEDRATLDDILDTG
ncbi:WD_REPEATS_REGION domain-containing protein, partial [Mortierella sp. AD032]